MRYELTDNEWTTIRPMLPNKPRGVPRVNDRRVLNGIFWVLRSGAPWRDLPAPFGPYTTCYNRFVRWRRARVGQGAFRIMVTDAYRRRCVITGERTLPALEAAHIKPFAEGGSHDPTNGLLLRRDIHALFDMGYVTVAPDLRFNVSRKIKEEFENGRDYYQLHGQPIAPAISPNWSPDTASLAWHNEQRYLG